MKGYRKIMKAVAVILAFALIFSGMNVPGTALALQRRLRQKTRL